MPGTKNKLLSIPTLKPSQIRSLTQKSGYIRRHYWNQVNSIPTLKSSQFRCLHTKTKLISIHTLKLSVFSIPTQKPSHFRSLLRSQVRYPHWNQVNSDHPKKKCEIRTPTQKSSECRHATRIKSISILTIKSSQFSCRDTQTKLISIHTPKLDLFRPPH